MEILEDAFIMVRFLKEKLEYKQNNLLEIYEVLKKLQRLTLNDLKNDLENIWAVSFGLITAIEAILDISQYILADKGIKTESYGSIPKKLLESNVVNQKFSEHLQKMIGFRNRAIHNYPSLDVKELHNILQNDIEDFKKILSIANKYK